MNYNNPYMQAYNPQMYSPQTPLYQSNQQQTQVIKVNGENGARAYQMGANSSALLLDESGTMVWLVTSDGAGYKTVTPYDISPHQTQPVPDFSSLEARISRLEETINATNTTDFTAVKRGRNGKPTNGGSDSGD